MAESEMLFNLRQLMDLEARRNGGLSAPPKELTDRERLLLMNEVYDGVLNGTNTFHGRTGGDLAYLLGAISKVGTGNKKAQFSPRSAIAKLLRDNFPLDHKVWSFIEFTS